MTTSFQRDGLHSLRRPRGLKARLPGVLLAITVAGLCATRAGIQTDIVYGTTAGQKLLLDACVPDGRGPFPAVILVHGGAWTTGDKSGDPDKGYLVPMHEPLARAKFAWFSINYRLAPAHHYPACVEDVETAIRWLKTHAAEYSPLNRVKTNLPPFLLVHGTADTRVPFQQSINMQSCLRASGVPCELITIPEGRHGMLPWDQLAPNFKNKVLDWLRHTLRMTPDPEPVEHGQPRTDAASFSRQASPGP